LAHCPWHPKFYWVVWLYAGWESVDMLLQKHEKRKVSRIAIDFFIKKFYNGKCNFSHYNNEIKEK
jgi:hypothetical protein